VVQDFSTGKDGKDPPATSPEDRLMDFFSDRPAAEESGRAALWLKRLLPIAVVIALAVVVLWPSIQDTGTNITLSYKDIETHGEEIRMTGAKYAGTDAKNRPFEVSADLAVQDSPKAVTVALDGVKASIDLGDQGIYRPKDEQLDIKGGIELTSDTGYRLSASDAHVNLKTGQGHSDLPVSGAAPFGAFSANGFDINVHDRTLVLDGSVKVRLEPGEPDSESQSPAPSETTP
jgi:lipopolysaccharide export system protein LptC